MTLNLDMYRVAIPDPGGDRARRGGVLLGGLIVPASWLIRRRAAVRGQVRDAVADRHSDEPRLAHLPHRDDGTRARPDGSPSVSVVVPALNEADSIGWVLENIPAWVDEVVLVDGLSIDRTEVVARMLVPHLVVVHQRNRGKGAALRAGFHAASGDIVAMIDADGSTDPRELGRFVEALGAGADFVKGSREMPGGGSVDFTRLRRSGNRGFVALANLIYGTRFTDLLYGYCAFWKSHLEALELSADGFEIETQLVLNAVKAGLRVTEVPSLELPRRAGASNLNAVRDGLRILETMLLEHPHLGEPSAGEPLEMVEIVRPAPDAAGWRPAGTDRRYWTDRRVSHLRPDAPRYIGPERRRSTDRRTPADVTVPVLLPRPRRERRRAFGADYDGPERRSGLERSQDALARQVNRVRHAFGAPGSAERSQDTTQGHANLRDAPDTGVSATL